MKTIDIWSVPLYKCLRWSLVQWELLRDWFHCKKKKKNLKDGLHSIWEKVRFEFQFPIRAKVATFKKKQLAWQVFFFPSWVRAQRSPSFPTCNGAPQRSCDQDSPHWGPSLARGGQRQDDHHQRDVTGWPCSKKTRCFWSGDVGLPLLPCPLLILLTPTPNQHRVVCESLNGYEELEKDGL